MFGDQPDYLLCPPRTMYQRYVIGQDMPATAKEKDTEMPATSASSGFQAFSGTGSSLTGAAAHADSSTYQDSEEEQLRKAIELSLQQETATALVQPRDEPERGATGSVRLQLKLPDGKRLQRRFHQDEQVQSIFAFLAQSWGPADASGVRLAISGGDRSSQDADAGDDAGALTLVRDGDKSLLEAGLAPSASLNCWAPQGSW
jgi:hypothetical protein